MNLNKYSDFVVKKLVNLQNGDALSINTEEISFDLAREIANTALSITNYPVKILVTENGKPVDVTDFEPEGVFSQPKSMAMIRINYIKKDISDQNSLNVVVNKDDLPTCQKLNHLSEPIERERVIAVPFCVVPFYDSDDERWSLVEKKIESFDSDELIVKYRKQNLQNLDIHTLHFKGENTDFQLTLPENVEFSGNLTVLRSQRHFYDSIDISDLVTVVEKDSIEGKFYAETKVFGKKVKCNFIFKDGNLDYDSSSFELKQLFGFENNIRKPGYIKMSDKNFYLYLGGALFKPVRNIIKADEELPDYLNDSIYSLELKLEDKLSITAVDCEGKDTEIVRKGFFLD